MSVQYLGTEFPLAIVSDRLRTGKDPAANCCVFACFLLHKWGLFGPRKTVILDASNDHPASKLPASQGGGIILYVRIFFKAIFLLKTSVAMLAEVPPEEYVGVLDCVATEALAEAGIDSSPVDPFLLARAADRGGEVVRRLSNPGGSFHNGPIPAPSEPNREDTRMSWDSLRLSRLSVPGKLLVTLFLGLVGFGYLFGTANTLLQHQDADMEPGLGLNDLRRAFHGLEKTVTPEAVVTVHSLMLEEVAPEGEMREHLEKGGEPAIRSLIGWLQDGAKEEGFAKGDVPQVGDPSPRAIIKSHCIECHHADGGDMEDLPFAANDQADPQYTLVMEAAKPEFETQEKGPQTLKLSPISMSQLVQVTHVHMLSIPVFTLLVGMLFLMTGFGDKLKLLLGPLPMLFVLLDIGSWWAARLVEPFIYAIAASGAIFGATFALQILCILASMWLGMGDKDRSIR